MVIDNDLMMLDRIQKIQAINDEYDLEQNAYLSFSGGKDSTILHYLLDIALPQNKIPRVFINTGIEYKMLVEFVKDLAIHDDRIKIIAPSKNIKEILEKYGYPFKSKEHSKKLKLYKSGSNCEWVINYLDEKRISRFKCPKILRYQFNKEFTLKVSDKCCSKLKKEVIYKWQKENKKSITITGMRKEEGGQRTNLSCILTNKKGDVIKFHPLAVVTEEWEEWFIKNQNIKLCDLYYEPYNFKRTGCKGCPFSLDLQKQLTIMETYLPNERKQCETIWKPVYDEYRRIGYRLKKNEQLRLF